MILILLVALGLVLIAEGLFVAEPSRLVGDGLLATVAVAAACGVGIGLVSSLLGVAGGELIIPVFILHFGVDVNVAGSMSMLVGMPTVAMGLLRHLAAGSVLREPAVWRAPMLPLGLGSVLGALALGLVPGQALKIGHGIILIWSALGVFRHLPRPTPAATSPRGRPVRVQAHDPEWSLTTLIVDGLTVTVPRRTLPLGSDASVTVANHDVTLALVPAAGSSALNTLSGLVARIEPLPDGITARVHVAIATGGEIAALVTRRSVAAICLTEGGPVFARFTTTAVQ